MNNPIAPKDVNEYFKNNSGQARADKILSQFFGVYGDNSLDLLLSSLCDVDDKTSADKAAAREQPNKKDSLEEFAKRFLHMQTETGRLYNFFTSNLEISVKYPDQCKRIQNIAQAFYDLEIGFGLFVDANLPPLNVGSFIDARVHQKRKEDAKNLFKQELTRIFKIVISGIDRGVITRWATKLYYGFYGFGEYDASPDDLVRFITECLPTPITEKIY